MATHLAVSFATDKPLLDQLLILRHFSDIEQGTGLIVDYKDRTVIKVRYTEIQSVITLLGFKPRNVYGNWSDDLLVAICCDDFKQTKVVRYSEFNKKQSSQYNAKGKPF